MSDLIEREDAISALRFEYPAMPWFKESREEWLIKTEGYRKAEEIIMKIPSARPKGEWQMDEDDDIYHCSKCFFEIDASGCIDPTEYISIYNFCPNCGSDNREREGE